MNLLQLAKDLSERLYTSFRRFPLPLLYATATVCILILINHLDYRSQDIMEIYTRIAMTLAIGVPLSLALHVFFETKSNIKKHFLVLAHTGIVVILIFFYFLLLKQLDYVSGTRYAAYTIAFYLIFSFIPFMNKKENYEIYMIRLFSRFVVTYIYSLVLYLGLAAILLTINLLFNAGISGSIYADIAFILAGVFAPSFFLAEIPRREEKITIEYYPKVLRALLQFIIAPLVSVYTIILYLYFGKIIITMTLPEGIIGNLVLWYSIISTIVIFLIYPLRRFSPWIRFFLKVFPKVIIPLLGMMFLSIGIRINIYGITEDRYFVVLAGLWVLFVMIYYSFKKDAKSIILTISLASLLIISVTGFFSAYSISKWSQNKRFEDVLERNHMIGEQLQIIHPPKDTEVSKEDQERMSSILLYFSRYHDLNDVKYLPKNFKMSDMESIFGFKLENNYYQNREYFSFHLYNNNIFTDITDFDYFGEFANYDRDNQTQKIQDYLIAYNYDDQSFVIKYLDRVIYEKNLKDIVIRIYQQGDTRKEMSVDEMTLIDENENIKLQMIFKQINGFSYRTDNDISIDNLGFYSFIKFK